MPHISNGLAFIPVAASLVTGCASLPQASVQGLDDDLVPVSSLHREAPAESSFVRNLSPAEKETWRNMALSLGAGMGAKGDVQSAIAVRMLQMLQR